MNRIIRDNNGNDDFRDLIVLLDKELYSRYGDIQSQYDQYNKVDGIESVVIGYVGEIPAGCGCFKLIDTDTIEIKRMFVKPEFRGSGLAKLIIMELEQWAGEKGYAKSILETGIEQPDAIKFYTKLGYGLTVNYGQYIGNPNSICMSKCFKS